MLFCEKCTDNQRQRHFIFTETWFVFPRHDYVNEFQNRHGFVDDEKAHGRGGKGVWMRHLPVAAD